MTPNKPILALAIGLALVLKATLAAAGGLESLDQFVKTTKSGRAEFTQSVTAPPKDGVLARPKNSAGSFEFARPNRFRFVYRKPFEQTIVADGTTLWLFDVDLNQVTARKQAQALGSTPAALIATAASLKALEAEERRTKGIERTLDLALLGELGKELVLPLLVRAAELLEQALA